ncbi:MAG: hypothetical protein KBT73_11425 [Marinobacter sp.]|nr:hypothetical protein [Marinobacter sp.]|tara:strand:+ start:153 stop:992 length:840 start_codon:yes stop_codon:yes gene_type:complete
MSEENKRQMSARLDEMSKRIDRLQSEIDAPKPKKLWYRPTTPGEFITFIGIPAALVAALWGFYDGVWLKLQRLDTATLTMAQDRLVELQDLRSEIFVLQARQNDAEIAAILEAKAGRRDRLVEDSFVYWTKQPSYFSKKETILLAEELQLQQRQGDALKVIATVAPVGIIERTDLERFKGSLYGAEGPDQDLEAARKHYKAALQHASQHSSEAGKQQLWAKITYSWLFTELSNRTGCQHAAPVADILGDLLADDPDGENLGVVDPEARKLLEVEARRCD